MQLKAMQIRTNLYTIHKNGLQTNVSKIDGITFCGGAHTQKGFRKSILSLNGSESHPHMFAKYFTP